MIGTSIGTTAHGDAVTPSNYNVVILVQTGAEARGNQPAYVRYSAANGGVDATCICPVTAQQGHFPDRRLEILDNSGVVRVVLGLLHEADGARSEAYGLSLRGADGRERVELSVDDHGPTLVFVRGGNIAIQLGVDEPEFPDDHAGPFVTLADARGVPLLSVSVDNSGSLQIRAGSEPPSSSTSPPT